MPLFKRSANQLHIPPIESTSQTNTFSARDEYSRSRGVGDVYARGGLNPNQLDQDRNELFSGYDPAKSGSGRFFEGDNIDEEEDVEAIKRTIASKKQESVKSTQSSIRLAREAVETGNKALKKLEEQSERLGNTELHLDRAKGHSARADDKTEELRKLNRSIFIPAVTFNNDAKHDAREAKVQRRYEEKRAQREKMVDAPMSSSETMLSGGRRIRSTTDRSRFQFEANASDDEMEDALENNLDEIQGLVHELRGVTMAMNAELKRQDGMISVLDEKTVNLDQDLTHNTVKLHRAGGR
ncbi:synaptosome-associated proteinsynaptosomal-associated protein 25 [Mycena albidolilacea]|uniref:Synaptosome-associated proteinsynaptosomal-associated protein 25 n=1 Tax=Mycena albidolilacea TaxID=1033008 RepID=A0AAD7ATV5_9AGAR|nr:synaptosome-associated proteinsynaptosomal-associated protein 25 [Mycena albidolilacea]